MAISVGDAVIQLKLVKTDFEEGMRKVGAEVDKSAREMQKGMRIVGAAITAVSVVGLKMVGDARKMNAELGQLAITTGLTKGELRGMAIGLSSVCFSLGEVIGTLGVLTRAGITNKTQLEASAKAFDELADATGMQADAVAEMLIPGFKALGMEIPTTVEAFDKFTWLVKNTQVNLTDFASAMDYIAIYGDKLNISMDDVISIMAILQDRGIQGSRAMRAFRGAVTDAVDGNISLNEALGITQVELTNYSLKIGTEAVGATQKYADAAEEQYGIMDKLKTAWADMTLGMGTFLEPLEPIMGFFTTVGTLMMALSLINIPKLIGGLNILATAFIGIVGPALKAVGALIAQAAASIWAAHGIIPFIGVGLAIAGVVALMASIRSARAEATALAEGGIVTRPTRALIGEAGPEAVIPLSRGLGTREVHLHIENYMGDDVSRRKLMRDLKQFIQEDDRRNLFGQLSPNYGYTRGGL